MNTRKMEFDVAQLGELKSKETKENSVHIIKIKNRFPKIIEHQLCCPQEAPIQVFHTILPLTCLGPQFLKDLVFCLGKDNRIGSLREEINSKWFPRFSAAVSPIWQPYTHRLDSLLALMHMHVRCVLPPRLRGAHLANDICLWTVMKC